jgi:undecaprenyl-diphosphatase
MQRLLERDAQASQRLRVAESPGILRTLAAVLAHSGDSWFWFLGLAGAYWLGDPGWKRWAGILLIAILATAVVVMAIKFSVRRRRPEGNWGNIYRSTDPHSFPSGHAARAWLVAVLSLGLAPAPWAVILLAVWAPLVSLARVAMGLHYLSDVLAGALLGLVIGGVVIFIL